MTGPIRQILPPTMGTQSLQPASQRLGFWHWVLQPHVVEASDCNISRTRAELLTTENEGVRKAEGPKGQGWPCSESEVY